MLIRGWSIAGGVLLLAVFCVNVVPVVGSAAMAGPVPWWCSDGHGGSLCGFGSVCGSSLATASTMGKVALPELARYRYSGSLATGTVGAGGVLGIQIPPSVVLVIFGLVIGGIDTRVLQFDPRGSRWAADGTCLPGKDSDASRW